MKKGLTFGTFVGALMLSTMSFAQQGEEIRKEVRMEVENGVKTLYITTTSNGVTTEEVLTGEAAEMRLADEMDGRGMEETVSKEVMVTEENGETVVTIITSTQGKIRTEVFKGEEAQEKLKELEVEDKANGELHRSQNTPPSIEGNN
jgi:hypothetical protein